LSFTNPPPPTICGPESTGRSSTWRRGYRS
jgi:hypothetical protein